MNITVEIGTSVRDAEKMLILATVSYFSWMVTGGKLAAANALGMSLPSLYNKLHRYEKSFIPAT